MFRIALLSILNFCTATVTLAQSPDPSLWIGDAVNPNGERPIPMFVYDSDTGIVWMNTLGINQISETDSGTLIGGDDVGIIAVSVSAIGEPIERYMSGLIEQDIGSLVFSNQSFGDKHQFFGVGATAQYLQPSERIDIFRFAPNLPRDNFYLIEVGINFAEGEPGTAIFGEMQFSTISIDFNSDGQFDCTDADALSEAIVNEPDNLLYDLTGDGIVNERDFDQWLDRYGTFTFGSGGKYLRGDANFDGVVDVRDFNLWNNHRFSTSTSYCDGNFNLDERIDVSDFNVWLSNKFQSSVDSVPEPSPWGWLLVTGILVCRQPNTTEPKARS